MPWLIIGGGVVLAGLAVLVVVLLTRSGSDGPSAAGGGPAAVPAPSTVASEPAPDEPEPQQPAQDAPLYAGSEDVARAWVDAMEQGEFQTAFDLSCAEVQAAATVSATEGEDPAWTLGGYFFERVLGGVGFTDHTFDGISHDSPSDTDLATFSLAMDDGTSYPLRVYVVANGTVCDFR